MSRLRIYSCAAAAVILILTCSSGSCYEFEKFGFDFHHRFSDPVKGVLGINNLPPKGSVEYYNAWAKRDQIFHGRRLSAAPPANYQTPLTFLDGNETYRLDDLGYLHYANVTVGTPPLSFIVALDTGSDLFWLPCDCSSCVPGLVSSTGETIDFNIYSLNTSKTSSEVPCSSDMCGLSSVCTSSRSACPYQVQYLSDDTSSTGILVEDVLHLITNDKKPKSVKANITFGCGRIQTGSFLESAAPNGLFGLGMDIVSVPSILAKENLASNSFSMCFQPDGFGRISFGDKGSSDQGKTPFNLEQSHPAYNVSITQINVGGNVQNVEFSAIFDSGTSFTYLSNPAYTFITESFNKLALDERDTSLSDSSIPFEYCYYLSRAKETNFSYPVLNLTMKGGDTFFLNDPIATIPTQDGGVYCLGIIKSDDVNIIGQNFMTGYRVVFDKEDMVLGWKESDCNDIIDSNNVAVEAPTAPVKPPTAVPAPAVAVSPRATSPISEAPPPSENHSSQAQACALVIFLCSLLAFV